MSGLVIYPVAAAAAVSGGTPDPTSGSGVFTLNEIMGDLYPGYADAISGGSTVARTESGYTAYCKHDVSPMPNINGVLDWSVGAEKKVWPSDGSSWSTAPYHNVWWQICRNSTDKRVIVDLSDPVVYYSTNNGADPWVKGSYSFPNRHTMWTAYIKSTSTSPFQQLDGPDAVYDSSGGFFSIDLTGMPSDEFAHGAYDYYDNRIFVPNNTAISTQFKARIRPAASGVDMSQQFVYVNCGNDVYKDSTTTTLPVNNATGESRFKRIPTDGSWREIGFHTVTASTLASNPPPMFTL